MFQQDDSAIFNKVNTGECFIGAGIGLFSGLIASVLHSFLPIVGGLCIFIGIISIVNAIIAAVLKN